MFLCIPPDRCVTVACLYLLMSVRPHKVQSIAGSHGHHSTVGVFVSVSCSFVSICKKINNNVSTQFT
ncbi:hypothetical protein EYF80_062796 [Liparis tanakae]|uniref:Uncharacterized protein n=1 Tax=Liparis tanakae TaxID=230148 RepID=A0A4Z2EE90_9TELE|nr:hypothetical protein EYF80_062796 [Liparis tanakae]